MPEWGSDLAQCSAVSNKRRWPLLGAGVPLGLFLLLVAAWGIDSVVSSDQVVRNVVVETTNLGGLTEADVVQAGTDLTTRFSSEPLTITIGDTSVSTDPVSLGARIDGERLAADALAARRGGFFLFRPFRWIGTFFSDETIEAHYVFDDALANQATLDLINPLLTMPSDPELGLSGNMLTVIPGSDGAIVDPGVLAAALPAAIESGSPYEVTVPSIPLKPDVGSAELKAIMAEANEATADPIVIQVLDTQVELDGTDIRSWISLSPDAQTLDWIVDTDKATAALQPLFPTLGEEGQQATFKVIDGEPIIVPAAESVVCCDEQTGDLIKIGLMAAAIVDEGSEDPDAENEDKDDEEAPIDPSLRVIRLQPSIAGSDEGVAELEALGIIEEISTFTTNHKCCENRVTNIQLMASIVQGYVIRPGESFDLNDVVGRRTSAAGFKPAGAIANGILEAQVGGGVSQFTTTIFNAAFFGGLDINEYQSHSLYFSRYPKGREATVSFPKPDFIISNPTEYGVLVWPTWTDTSITVTFYSTQNVDVFCVAKDGSLVSGAKECDKTITGTSQGHCTRWTTKRERVFENGDVKNDKVFAVYRPAAGLDCNGNSTVPTTTNPDATTTTVEGETSTTVEGETPTTGETTPTTVTETTPTTVTETSSTTAAE